MTGRHFKYIYWFAYYNLDSPSVRYRAKYPLDFAKKQLSIQSRLIIPGYTPKTLIIFIQSYFSALLFPKEDSIIVIQRVRSNFIYGHLLKLLVKIRKKRTVYDLDDADYLEENPRTIHFFARNCNYIWAGSVAIANYLRQFNENVVHVTSPTPDLGIVKQERNKTFTIGWVGGFGCGHKDSLFKYIFPAIKNLEFDCRFIIVGVTKESDEKDVRAYFKGCDHVQFEIPRVIDWNDEESLQKRIIQFDIGIATLLDQPIQIAKSGIKAKQYMNNGIPVLCNDLPENNKFVINGYNGFVCSTESEFEKRLIQFKEMKDTQYWEFSDNANRSRAHFSHFKYFEDLGRINKQHPEDMVNKQWVPPIFGP